MNHLRSTTTPHQSRTRWIALAFFCVSLALMFCTDARAARVVDLPASGNAADPQLAMTDSGAYAITWRQQPTFGENERVYAQTGTASRPFRTKPTSPGLTKNLSGPVATVASSGRDGLAWLSGSGTSLSVRFLGPRSPRSRTVAWVENNKTIIVAKLSAIGSIVSLSAAYTEPSAAELADARVRVDGADNPTVYWTRDSLGCPDASNNDIECVRAGVLVATGDGAGGFGQPQLVAPDCETPQMVEAASGAAAITVSCGTQLKFSHRAPGQPFAEPTSLPLGGAAESGQFSLTLRLGSEVLLAYETANSFDSQTVRANLMLAAAPIGQPLGSFKVIRRGIRFESANNPPPSPRLIVTKRGRAYLRWLQDDRTKLALVKSSRRIGRAMTVPGFDRRGLNTMDAEVSITDRGKALAVWNFISIKIDPAVRATTFVAPTK